MIRTFAALVLLSILSLSCSEPVTTYVHEPKYGKNISTLFGFEKESADINVVPDFTWKDSNGVLRSLSDLRDKIVLVNFWATWCGPCLAETPALRDIAIDFAKDSVVVIGISIDQSGEIYPKVEEFLRSKNLGYQVITDPGLDVYEAYTNTRNTTIPVTFIIDVDGRLYTALVGEQQYDTFADNINELL
jgi:peroxiredoxin